MKLTSDTENRKTKVVLLNGPPGCGKDTLANHLSFELLTHYNHILPYTIKQADPLHAFWTCIFGEIPADKNAVDEELGISYRDGCIELSEDFMKPNFGQDIFGYILLRRMKVIEARYKALPHSTTFFISDCGFVEESLPLLTHFDPEDIMLLRITRDGCDFSKDSRGYINLDEFCVESHMVENTTIDKFVSSALDKILPFLGNPPRVTKDL